VVRPVSAGRDELVAVIQELAREAHAGKTEEWENVTLPAYLEALAGWLKSYENAYINTGRAVPENPWEIMKTAFMAATTYE
jgi:hypothetical protein